MDGGLVEELRISIKRPMKGKEQSRFL